MNEPLQFVDELIQNFLSKPAAASLPPEERKQIADELKAHCENLVVETLINRLDAAQVKELRTLTGSEGALQDKLQEYAVSVPGLAADIEARVRREFEVLNMAV